MTHEALIARLEALTGPSRAADADIARHFGKIQPSDADYLANNFTFSLDAALTLVPEGWEWTINGTTASAFARVANAGLKHEPAFVAHLAGSNSPTRYAIALTIAALKAREASTP